jgi:membrane-associated phospholipid phosphatase
VSPRRRPRWLVDAERVDHAVYAAVATTPTPSLDRGMSALSHAADASALWVAAAVAMAVAQGPRGRRAAGAGLASIALTSGVVNLVAKPLARRRRPDRLGYAVPLTRHVPMPTSRSLPSGHAASAFAFATGAGHVLHRDGAALRVLAAAVAYSRVHTGVHFPADVVAGALLGTVCSETATRAIDRRRARRRHS